MKDGWRNAKVGEVCTVIAGQSPDGSFYNKDGDGMAFYQGKKDFGEKFLGPPTTWTRQITRIAEAGDILMSVRAPVGPVNFATDQVCIGRGLAAIRVSHELDRDFLFYFFKKHERELVGSDGAVFNSINKTEIENIAFPLPPIEEQRRIVAILDEAFACIDKAKANTEKNIQNARELFDSYLNNIFSNPSPDWETSTLEESNKFIDYRGKTPAKTESGVRLITAKNVKPGYLTQEPEEFIATSDYKSWMTRGIPQKGDILFTTEAPLANVAQLDTDEKVAFAQRVIILQPNRQRVEDRFLKYQLLSRPAKEKILKHGSGATVQGIKAKLLKTIPIDFPVKVSDQKEIADRLDIMWDECWNAEDYQRLKIEELEKLKKSILQKAFSGEL